MMTTDAMTTNAGRVSVQLLVSLPTSGHQKLSMPGDWKPSVPSPSAAAMPL